MNDETLIQIEIWENMIPRKLEEKLPAHMIAWLRNQYEKNTEKHRNWEEFLRSKKILCH